MLHSHPLSPEVQQSYVWCQNVARRSASNFYYAFYLLPKQKRQSMCALYSFLRYADDLSEADRPVTERRILLGQLRSGLASGLQGEYQSELFPALIDTVHRHQIPERYLFDALDGVEMDLDHQGFDTFEALETYCYRVASVVGLSCIHIWGFRGNETTKLAIDCGLAFQLTNILRDLYEDAASGRVYLPKQELAQFGYTPDDLLNKVTDQRFESLMQFQIARAEAYFRSAQRLAAHLYWDGRRILGCMIATYQAILDQIKYCRAAIFQKRIRVSNWQKTCILAKSLLTRTSVISAC